MSYGDEMVRLLERASGDTFWTPDDRMLAEAAGEWLGRHGWRFNDRMGFVCETVSFCGDEHGDGIVVRRRINGMWEAEGQTYRVDSSREALNMLAAKELIDGRFATFGRDALTDHAQACEEAAFELETQGVLAMNGAAAAYASTQAEGLRQAALSARRLYPLRIPA